MSLFLWFVLSLPAIIILSVLNYKDYHALTLGDILKMCTLIPAGPLLLLALYIEYRERRASNSIFSYIIIKKRYAK